MPPKSRYVVKIRYIRGVSTTIPPAFCGIFRKKLHGNFPRFVYKFQVSAREVQGVNGEAHVY